MASRPAPKRPAKRAAREGGDVDSFLAALGTPARREIDAVRRIFLDADPKIAEGIKWNSPSFRTTEWFATVNTAPKGGVRIVLHFGAKKCAISTTGVAIQDPQSLLQWLGKDRAMVVFRDATDVAAKRAPFTKVIREWIRHVSA